MYTVDIVTLSKLMRSVTAAADARSVAATGWLAGSML
jgi:hypothetical protein